MTIWPVFQNPVTNMLRRLLNQAHAGNSTACTYAEKSAVISYGSESVAIHVMKVFNDSQLHSKNIGFKHVHFCYSIVIAGIIDKVYNL